MKVDVYVSAGRPTYGVFLPAGADIQSISGQNAAEVAKLAPLNKRSTHELAAVFHGALLSQVEAQIRDQGAAVVRAEVHVGPIA